MTDEINVMDELEEAALEAEETEVTGEAAETAAAETSEAGGQQETVTLSPEERCGCAEAILFAMGNSVDIGTLSFAMGCTNEETMETLSKLNDQYEQSGRGIFINRLEDRVQLCTKREYYPQLIKIAARPVKPTLTPSVLETLCIVAYKQPVTKGDIERIRGVKSDFAVNKLIEYGLITEAGRLDTPGRPILFTTTEEFLRRFGLASSAELPQADPEKLKEIEKQARQEVTV